MKTVLVLSALILAPFVCSAQDAQLRSWAASLLESATAASIAPNLPNLKRVNTFRVFDPDAKAREGSFTRTVLQGVGRREETIFGAFNVVSVWTGPTLATTDMHPVIPREVASLMRLTPINLVRFDASDVNQRNRGQTDRWAPGALYRVRYHRGSEAGCQRAVC